MSASVEYRSVLDLPGPDQPSPTWKWFAVKLVEGKPAGQRGPFDSVGEADLAHGF